MVLLKHGLEKHSQGTFLLTDLHTGKTLFEGHLRQCIHCQNTWTYRPGSGILRGFCNNCDGHLCGRPQCETCYHKEKQIEDMEAAGRQNRVAIEAFVRQIELKERIAGAVKDQVQKAMRRQESQESREERKRLVVSR